MESIHEKSSFSKITNPAPNSFVLGTVGHELPIQLTQVRTEPILHNLYFPPGKIAFQIAICSSVSLCLRLFNMIWAKFNRRAEGSEVGRRLTSVTDPGQMKVVSHAQSQHVPPGSTCTTSKDSSGHCLLKAIHLKHYFSCQKYKPVQDGISLSLFFSPFLCS